MPLRATFEKPTPFISLIRNVKAIGLSEKNKIFGSIPRLLSKAKSELA